MRTIDADKLKEIVNDDINRCYMLGIGNIGPLANFIDYIDAQPTLDVAHVVHGKWILGRVEPGYLTPGGNRPWICSECGQVVSWRLDRPKENYCSKCGTKMDGEINE